MKTSLFYFFMIVVVILLGDTVIHAQVKTKIYYEGIPNKMLISALNNEAEIIVTPPENFEKLLAGESVRDDSREYNNTFTGTAGLFSPHDNGIQIWENGGALPLSKRTSLIEITPYMRWDKYPTFINSVNNIASYRLAIRATSWGINTAYRIPLKKNFCFGIGLGYYRYSFTHIVSTHQSFGESDKRVIDYPTQLDIILGTDNYWYNTVSLNLGLGKSFDLSKDFTFIGGVTVKNYFTFSQRYHIPFDNSFIPQPELQIENNYKTNTSRYFGLGTELNLAVLKKTGKVDIGPSLIIPVIDLWKQDAIFPTETNLDSRNKWFRGFGVGIKLIYSL